MIHQTFKKLLAVTSIICYFDWPRTLAGSVYVEALPVGVFAMVTFPVMEEFIYQHLHSLGHVLLIFMKVFPIIVLLFKELSAKPVLLFIEV